MKNLLVTFLCGLAISYSCSNNHNNVIKIGEDFGVIYLFGDSCYRVELNQMDSNTSVLLFYKFNDNKKILLSDTLTTEKYDYEVTDFDKNGTLDILIQKELAQNNPSYYLYLNDSNNKSLTRVKKFERLFTPKYDSINKLVISYKRIGNEFLYALYTIDEAKLLHFENNFRVLKNDDVDSLYTIALKKVNKRSSPSYP